MLFKTFFNAYAQNIQNFLKPAHLRIVISYNDVIRILPTKPKRKHPNVNKSIKLPKFFADLSHNGEMEEGIEMILHPSINAAAIYGTALSPPLHTHPKLSTIRKTTQLI